MSLRTVEIPEGPFKPPHSPFSKIFEVGPDNQQPGELNWIAQIFIVGDLTRLKNLRNGPLVRMHSACTYSVLGAADCECRPQLAAAKEKIIKEGGIIILLNQEGRQEGHMSLVNKARALQEVQDHPNEAPDTFAAYPRLGLKPDGRDYSVAIKFLLDNGITKMRLLSNSSNKKKVLDEAGIQVELIPLIAGVTMHNKDELEVKRRQGYILPENLQDLIPPRE